MKNAPVLGVICLLGLVQISVAQFKSQAAYRESAVEGSVTLQGTAQPIKGAHILIASEDIQKKAIADDRGRYRIDDLQPGRYLVKALGIGFVQVPISGILITVESMTLKTDLRLEMAPAAQIAGQILGDERTKTGAVLVQALSTLFENGSEKLVVAGQAESDANGNYEIRNLPPGDYYIVARNSRRSSSRFPATYFPGVATLLNGMKLRVSLGEKLRPISFHLAPSRTFTVKLKLTSLDEDQPSNVRFYVISRENSAALQETSIQAKMHGPDLYLLNDLVPGQYDIIALSKVLNSTGAVVAAEGYTQITIGDHDLDDVRIDLLPRRSMSGQLSIEGMTKAAVDLKNVAVLLSPSGGPDSLSIATYSVKDDGSFTIEVGTLQSYSARVTGLPRGMYVKSIKVGGVETNGNTVAVGPDALSLVVTMGADAGTISGHVRDIRGLPSMGSTAVLIPSQQTSAYYEDIRTAMTDDTGTFIFSDVIPGNYTVLAWKDGIVQPYTLDRKLLARFLYLSTPTIVRPSLVTNLEIVTISPP